MIVRAIKTRKVIANACTLQELLDETLAELPEGSVVAITSKVISLCEGRVLPMDGTNKEEIVAAQAQMFLPASTNAYGVTLSVARNQLIVAAGIDESNSNGHYVLWPFDPQASANQARKFLREKFGLRRLGVIVTDSSTRPFQWGTTGVSIAYSGFVPLYDYQGQKDLFGRVFEYQKNNIQNGLAAAAVVVGGEGAEQTPIVVLGDLDFVEFVDNDPDEQELDNLRIQADDDVYAQLIKSAPWRKGQG